MEVSDQSLYLVVRKVTVSNFRHFELAKPFLIFLSSSFFVFSRVLCKKSYCFRFFIPFFGTSTLWF